MQLASSTIKKCTLELGGKSPNIVFEDANLDAAVDGALWATFFHQGQVCESGTRLLRAGVDPRRVRRDARRARASRSRSATRSTTTRTWARSSRPRSSRPRRELRPDRPGGGREARARRQAAGRRPRGRLLLRADDLHRRRQLDDDRPGGDLRPGAVGDQVLSDDEAVRIANDTIYGLAAAVWSEDYDRCLEVAKKLRAGTVWINDHHLINCIAPFGGYKQSGIGRELGLLRPRRVHRGQARARGPHARPRAEDVRRAAVRTARGVGGPRGCESHPGDQCGDEP